MDQLVCFIIIFKGIPVKEIVKHRNYILLSLLSLSLYSYATHVQLTDTAITTAISIRYASLILCQH